MEDPPIEHPAVTRRRWRVATLESLLDDVHPETLDRLRTEADRDEAKALVLLRLAQDTADAEDFEAAAESVLDGDDLIEIARLEESEAELWRKLETSASS